MPGKLPYPLLKKYFFSRTGVTDKRVLVPPGVGEDSAIIDVNTEKILSIHPDPITGAVENIGWLAINISANDIAVSGCKPKWFTIVLLLPESYGEKELDIITLQINEALYNLDATLVGGHTEYTLGIERPIIVANAIGILVEGASTYVTTSGAKEGDFIVMTKTAALEATSILASDYEKLLLNNGITIQEIMDAKRMIKLISVVKEALLLASNNLVNSMHDPTEGGVIGGLVEIALSSKKTIIADANKIPIYPTSKKIFQVTGIDPLKSLSSGVLLASIPRQKIDIALNLLEQAGIKSTIIGKVKEGEPKLELWRNGEKEEYYEPPIDALILEEKRLEEKLESSFEG